MIFTGILCGILLPVLKFGGNYPVFTEEKKTIFTGSFQELFFPPIGQLVAVTFPGQMGYKSAEVGYNSRWIKPAEDG